MNALEFLKSRPNVPFSVRSIARKLAVKRKTVEFQFSNVKNIKKCNPCDVGSMKTKVNCHIYES